MVVIAIVNNTYRQEFFFMWYLTVLRITIP